MSPRRGPLHWVAERARRLTAPQEVVLAAELRERSRSTGALAVYHCQCGQVATVTGTLRSVTLRPVSGVPALQAELWDGSGSVSLMFLGRRRIVGIDPGRTLSATGRIARRSDGGLVIYNPAYDLLTAGA